MSRSYIVKLDKRDGGECYLLDCVGHLTDERSKAKRFASELYANRALERALEVRHRTVWGGCVKPVKIQQLTKE